MAIAESRYQALMGFGAFYFMGAQLGSVLAVLPFLMASEGMSRAAGLVVPSFSVGFVVGNALSPLAVKWSGRHQNMIIAVASATIAVLTVFVAVAALYNTLVVFAFLSSSVLIGGAMGVANNAYAGIISRALTETRRNDLVLNQQALGAILTVIGTLGLIPLLPHRDAADGHLDVLWLSAAAMGIAFVAAMMVGPSTSPTVGVTRRMIEDFREGIAVVRETRWYRVFLAAQLVFVPILVSETFFSLRTALAHVDTAESLHLIVISSAAGLVAGSFVWRRVFGRFGVRGILMSSAIVGGVATVVCAANELVTTEPRLWAYGVVFFLVVLANAAVAAGMVSWISAYAAEEERAVLISFAATLVAVATGILGAVFGQLALVTAIWPVLIILVLCALAALVAARAPGRTPVAG
ncbi:MFS transporter [Mycobacterium barrassiae]|uniref:MFS transporter n=1 Tax=Mycobacterium barrassiae TaxID=319709 RepID=UPI002265F102|nr:MFS transporter [Mycobacterium barrassiae]MCV7302305.1 MFS transporter [Mycobacterium barrassiae]